MKDIKLEALNTYVTNLTKYKDTVESESTALNDTLNSLPMGAWNDPEQKAFLDNFKTFYETAKKIQDQMNENIKFVAGCYDDYCKGQQKALQTLV